MAIKKRIAGLILAGLAVGCGDGERITRLQTQLDAQQKQLRELQGNLSKIEALDLDEKCANRAHAVFKENGYDKEPLTSFTNHYNSDMGKCFILIQSTDPKTDRPNIWQNRDLWDANERKEYASLASLSRRDPAKNSWDVQAVVCYAFLTSGEKKVCRYAEEFDALVKTYMGGP